MNEYTRSGIFNGEAPGSTRPRPLEFGFEILISPDSGSPENLGKTSATELYIMLI